MAEAGREALLDELEEDLRRTDDRPVWRPVHRDGRISMRAGAGTVADSVPQRELEETRATVGGMLLAPGEHTRE